MSLLSSLKRKSTAEHAALSPISEQAEGATDESITDDRDSSASDIFESESQPSLEKEENPGQPDRIKEEVEEPSARKSRLKGRLQNLKDKSRGKVVAHSVPIRVIIGYLPEVSFKDAKEYAMGVAEKHFEQMGLAHFDAFPCGQGFAFEVHEGGSGKAYLPEILDYFKSQGPFKPSEPLSVVIKTGTRLVVVQQLREGVASLILPESATEEPTPWLKGVKQMTPGLNRRTTFLKAGILVAFTGLLAMTSTALLFRLQPYEAPPPPGADVISGDKLPRSQWSKLLGLAPGSYVKALRFKNGVWQQPDVALISPSPTPVTAPSAITSAP